MTGFCGSIRPGRSTTASRSAASQPGWRPASGYDNLERTVTAVPNRDGTWNVTVASNGSYAAFASPIDGGPVIAQLAQ
jgi:hypothetical protein